MVGQQNGKVYIKTDESDIRFENGALVYVLDQDIGEAGAEYVLVVGEEIELVISRNILILSEMLIYSTEQ